jgi:hypothetical protein
MPTVLKLNYPPVSLEKRYPELYTSGCKKLGKLATIFTGKDPRDTSLILASSMLTLIFTTILALFWLGPQSVNSILLIIIVTPSLLLLIDSISALHGNDTLSVKTTRLLIFYMAWKDKGPEKVPAVAVLSEDLIARKAKIYLKSQNLSLAENENFYVLLSQWEGNLDSLITLCKNLEKQ